MSTIKTVNVIHPSGVTNNIVTDASGNVAVGGALTVSGVAAVAVAPGTSGNVLTSNGTNWTSATAPVINVQTFNASGTWTKPAGYAAGSRVLLEAWGAGGSGSRNSTATTMGGGGGGGYNSRWITLSALGATETITIGAGGASRTTTNQAGAAGGNTSIGTSLFAYGGSAGTITGANSRSNAGYGGGQLSAPLSAGGGNFYPGQPWIAISLNAGASDGIFHQGEPPGLATSVCCPNAELTLATFMHGGGGGYGGVSTLRAGCASLWGGGGGGGGATTAAPGGVSSFGGNGGAADVTAVAGSQPGGGGGGGTSTSGAGGAGRVIITVFPA